METGNLVEGIVCACTVRPCIPLVASGTGKLQLVFSMFFVRLKAVSWDLEIGFTHGLFSVWSTFFFGLRFMLIRPVQLTFFSQLSVQLSSFRPSLIPSPQTA